MHPDFENIQAQCATLEKISNSFPEGSAERLALFTAANAMHFLLDAQVKAKCRDWVDGWTTSPTALQVLNAKLMGIDDLPHELLDESMREVEQLMERLRHMRS